MRITVNDKEYHIRFYHHIEGEKKTTACHVLVNLLIYGFVDIGIGVAVCSHKDNFSRAVGRKIALSRAIRNCFPDKVVRKTVWRAVWEARKKVCARAWSV